MRAAVIAAPGEISLATVPDPTPGPRDVVVQVAACGICGTDLHILDGEFAPSLPIIPGHEFAGTIVAVGTAVTEVSVDMRVGVDPSLYCGECYYCKRARDNLCENWAAIGVTHPGGAAEYAVAPVKNCYVLPEHLSSQDAALIEPLSCAVRGYDALPRRLSDNILIYGAGTMGLMMTRLAARTGAGSVSVVDLNEERLAAAATLDGPATATSADAFDRARGWDVVIDCTGAPAAIRDGLSRVAPGGTFLQFGVAGEHDTVEFEPYHLYNKEITITGSMSILHSFDRAGDLLAGGLLAPDFMITHRLPLAKYADATAMVRNGVGRKIQVQAALS